MFGKKKEDQSAAPPKEAQSWDDKLASALPKKAQFFDSVRTDAYKNNNLVANYVEFWVALNVDQQQDKWRVMHYMIFDLDMADGKFKTEIASKEDCSFPEAIYHIAKFDSMASAAGTREPVQLTEEHYPAEKYPELKTYYYNIEHYHLAANIEGIAFDDAGHPYRRVEGKIVAESAFKRSEISRSILAVNQTHENPHLQAKMEGGVLSDMAETISDRSTTLDRLLQVGEILSDMDKFATYIGAFYLSVQKSLAQPGSFEKIGGLDPAEKEQFLGKADRLLGKYSDRHVEMIDILDEATEYLDQIEEKGVHIEPFKKFAAECEVYAYLLNASQKRLQLEQGFVSANNNTTNLIVEIRKSVDMAREKFMELGGTQEQMDKLNGWVASRNKDSIPGWLPGFLTRYYESRGKIMQTVQDRKQALQKVKTMTATVKPPLLDEFNNKANTPAIEAGKPDVPATPAPAKKSFDPGSGPG